MGGALGRGAMHTGTNVGRRVDATGHVRVRSNRHISRMPMGCVCGTHPPPGFLEFSKPLFAKQATGFWYSGGSVGARFRPVGQPKLIPCIEFELEHGFVYREYNSSPGYYDGRYWTMWKLPMFGCTDSAQVLRELDEAKKTYPSAFIRIIGFDNVRQVQSISFIAYKPEGY
ncbi:PREDICTED: ribulose bisphosphate carboxylase small chain, chloroplastic-like [Erythranthe guttata]|nr:PREDICTED: ribulose bisphosphate carboxylase small chain, chloroplastic-like [Erythranthe guttata]|eukprot:XP_012855964.1 PREDICTED: ribulose bisphosphate carboxylase small chain, chloroplastic-like [Erythranthe guttata]